MVGHVKKVILEYLIKKLSLGLLKYCVFCMQKKKTKTTNQPKTHKTTTFSKNWNKSRHIVSAIPVTGLTVIRKRDLRNIWLWGDSMGCGTAGGCLYVGWGDKNLSN